MAQSRLCPADEHFERNLAELHGRRIRVPYLVEAQTLGYATSFRPAGGLKVSFTCPVLPVGQR